MKQKDTKIGKGGMENQDLEFQKIYEVFQPKILRYMTRLAGDSESEDLTQEVFVKVNRTLANFRGECALSTWIYRIATNTAVDRLRSQLSRQTTSIPMPDSDDPGEESLPEAEERNFWTGTKALSVEQEIARKQMNECIRSFIERLPEAYRTVLVLSELEEISNQEIANILNITLGTVKIRLHRARAKLKEELEAHCDSSWIEENEFVPDLRKALEGQ